MKIGITCYPTYGGSGVVATELGMELAERDHEIHFISYAQPIRLSGPHPNIHYHEVEVSRYPLFEYPPYDLALASRMAEVAELYDLDLLHVHYAIPHSVSALLARQMMAAKPRGRKLPFVTTLHGTDITLVGLDRSSFPITRFSIEQSDGVTAISQYLQERTLREFDIRNEIKVIYNFVNCDVYVRGEDTSELKKEYARMASACWCIYRIFDRSNALPIASRSLFSLTVLVAVCSRRSGMMRRILPSSVSSRCGLSRRMSFCSPVPESPTPTYMTRQSGSPRRAAGLNVSSPSGWIGEGSCRRSSSRAVPSNVVFAILRSVHSITTASRSIRRAGLVGVTIAGVVR